MKPLLAVLVVLFLVPFTSAQTIDADMNLGSSFAGRLDATTDVDVLTFDTVKNTNLTVSVAGLKDKENKGNPILLPQVELLDLTTATSLMVVASGKKKSVIKLLLPSTGEYMIRISGTAGTSGPYKLTTKAKLDKTGKVMNESVETAGGADFSLSFDADAGFLLSALVKPDKKSLALPGVMTLSGPSGAIDISTAVVTNVKKSAHGLKKFPLTEQGTYTLTSTNDGADAGAIRGRIKLKPAKPVKEKLVESDVPGGVSIVRTLSGIVQNSNDGSGLPGVSITAGETLMATTDSLGRFIVHDPPTGEVHVIVDGSSTSAPGEFHQIVMLADVAPVGETVLMPVVLPDLSNPDSAKDDVAVTAGVTSEPIDATGADENIALAGPTGTTVTINGVAAVGSVPFSVTPVDPSQVPMPLVPGTGAVDAASYVTVGPANSTFDNGAEGGGATGLDIVLSNDRDFPVGTLVDIWSFDHGVEAWVNRSAQTGQQGEVVATMSGTQIVATGVITEGGWHAPVIPIDTDCATAITGRVVDTLGQPVPDAAVGTATGQFATTGGDGVFTLESVTAYNVASLPTCVLEDVLVNVLTPVSYGAVSASVLVLGGGITAGGTTDIGDIEVTVPVTGSLAGLLVDNGQPVMGTVDISDPTEGLIQTMSNENGSFFTAGLDAGDYSASYVFDGDSVPTSVDFTIEANALTTINLQRSTGMGVGDVTVLVLGVQEDSGDPPAPIQGASVMLVGTDGSSQGGVVGTTDANGEATFENVDGPFTVTAQVDRVLDFGKGPATVRFAHTLVGIDPPSGVIGILSEFEIEDDSPTVDATISGTISDLGAVGPNDFLSVQAFGPGGFQNFVNADTFTGAYSIPVPAGDDYRVVFNHATGVAETENRIFSAQVESGVDVTAGGNTTVDFNMTGAGAIAFDRQVDIDYSGLIVQPCDQVLQVAMFTGDGNDINLATLVFDVGALPDSVFLPSGVDAGLDGQRISLLLEQFNCLGIDDGAVCDVFLDDNPSVIDLDLPAVPAFLNPIQDDEIAPGVATDMTVSFENVAGQGANGIVFLELFTESPQQGVGVDAVVWELLLRAGTTSVQLPPTVLPMFGAGSAWEACVGSEVFEGFVFDYDAIFDADIGDIDATIDGQSDAFCESFAITEFTVD